MPEMSPIAILPAGPSFSQKTDNPNAMPKTSNAIPMNTSQFPAISSSIPERLRGGGGGGGAMRAGATVGATFCAIAGGAFMDAEAKAGAGVGAGAGGTMGGAVRGRYGDSAGFGHGCCGGLGFFPRGGGRGRGKSAAGGGGGGG